MSERSLEEAQGIILDPNREQTLKIAASAILQGKLVAFPTDTVYGLGTTPFNEQAIQLIYAAKRRQPEKGIPVLLADKHELGKVASSISTQAESLIAHFWPGPLTLVLGKNKGLPPGLSPNKGIAVRVPDHDLAIALIRAAGGAVATTSANLSAQPPARSAEEVQRQLSNELAFIVDGGPVLGELSSTVVDCTSSLPRLLRAGPISLAELQRHVQIAA